MNVDWVRCTGWVCGMGVRDGCGMRWGMWGRVWWGGYVRNDRLGVWGERGGRVGRMCVEWDSRQFDSSRVLHRDEVL